MMPQNKASRQNGEWNPHLQPSLTALCPLGCSGKEEFALMTRIKHSWDCTAATSEPPENLQGVSEQWPGAAWKEPTILLKHKSMQDCGALPWRSIDLSFSLKSNSTRAFISSSPTGYEVTCVTARAAEGVWPVWERSQGSGSPGLPWLASRRQQGGRRWYLGVDPLDALGGVLHPAVEVHGQHVLGASLLPGVAIAQPVVSLLHLQGEHTGGSRSAFGMPL